MSGDPKKSLGVKDPADGMSLDEIFGKVERITPQQPVVITHRLMWDDEMDDQEPMKWLVEGVLPMGVLAALYGEPGVGKSFLALDWAFSIATGDPWQGHKVIPGDVVYVCAEGWQGMKDRVAAWKAYRDVTSFEAAGVAFLGRSIQLMHMKGIEQFANSIEAQSEEIPKLIVIDTLARNAIGLEENSAEQMGKIVGSCDYLRERFGCTVLLLHHSTKPSKDYLPSLRGSGALKAALDTVVFMNETRDGQIRVYCEKQKDGGKFKTKWFKMVPVGKSIVLAKDEQIVKEKKQKKGEVPDDEFPPELGLGLD